MIFDFYSYLNYHVYVVFSLLSSNLGLVAICLLFCSLQLVVIGYYYYRSWSDNQQWPCTKVEEASGLSLGWSTGRDSLLAGMDDFSSVTHTYVCMLWMNLPICTATVGKTVDSCIFHDNNNCIMPILSPSFWCTFCIITSIENGLAFFTLRVV